MTDNFLYLFPKDIHTLLVHFVGKDVVTNDNFASFFYFIPECRKKELLDIWSQNYEVLYRGPTCFDYKIYEHQNYTLEVGAGIGFPGFSEILICHSLSIIRKRKDDSAIYLHLNMSSEYFELCGPSYNLVYDGKKLEYMTRIVRNPCVVEQENWTKQEFDTKREDIYEKYEKFTNLFTILDFLDSRIKWRELSPRLICLHLIQIVKRYFPQNFESCPTVPRIHFLHDLIMMR